MTSQFSRHAARLAVITLATCCSTTTFAVTANPLENAYWRFEEGTVGSQVVGAANNTVPDSINQNHMQTPAETNAPTYSGPVAPTPLKSGLSSGVALDFQNDDFVLAVNALNSEGGKNINNGMIGPPTAPNISGITIEAAFRPSVVDSLYHAIIGKDGAPVSGNPLQTLVLKIRGDNHKLQVEQFDGSGVPREVSSLNTINANQWYYAAVVNDSSTVKLYLDSTDGNGYILQGSTILADGAMWQGANHDSYSQAWTIGRGQYNGGSTDFFNGIIDEVRISNRALEPWEFLFAPQGDYTGDKIVDVGDYAVWRKTNVFGEQGYTLWRSNFGNDYNSPGLGSGGATIPEPASALLAAIAIFGVVTRRRRCVVK
jgi:hypothetical protein